jgi:hypothetical protein
MPEHLGTVIADRGDAQALGPELLDRSFQLDELGLAVRSPVGRAIEMEHRPLRSPDRLEVPDLSVRVSAAKRRDLLSDLDPGSKARVERVIGIERFLGADDSEQTQESQM